jgi:hypothetical protein
MDNLGKRWAYGKDIPRGYWKQFEKQARNEGFKVHEMEKLY